MTAKQGRYANGEPIKAQRMEAEDWYPDYQSLMELAIRSEIRDVEKLHQAYLEEYFDTYGQEPNEKHFEQSLRWVVLVVERHFKP